MSSITSCRGCGAPLPAPFLDLGATPLANSYVSPDQVHLVEPRYPLAVSHCPACALVQLTHTVPPAEMFSEYLYFSSYSDTFLEHARSMATDLGHELHLGAASLVLEVASNDGYLLQYFQRAGIPVLGVEPAANIAAEARRKGIPTLNRFFGPEAVPEILEGRGQADLVIGCNVLAHVPEIVPFLGAVRDCLKPGGLAVFEFPWVGALMAHCEFDTIYHEHVFYLSLAAVQGLAARVGLEVQDVTVQPVHGESLRVALQRPGARTRCGRVDAFLARERDLGLTTPARYEAFRYEVEALRDALVAELRRLKALGKAIAAYGAPAKGNTLLNYCGIGRDLLDFTVDRSPHKQGRLLPGSHLPIRQPQALLTEQPDYAVILPWNLADEIVKQSAEYLQRGGRFIVPVPRPREIGGLVKLTPLPLTGANLIDIEPIEDARGFFARTWSAVELEEHGLDGRIVQTSLSVNTHVGTVRGMHYQCAPHEETKVVGCARGALYDVIVDLRPASPTFRQWIGVELTAASWRRLYIPRGFAHGFQTLVDDTVVTYQMADPYHPESARGVRWNDPGIDVRWPLPVTVIADRDQGWPLLGPLA